MNKILSEVSVWYQELASGALFKVVAIDEPSSNIEYKLLDGELGVHDLCTWRQLNGRNAEAHAACSALYEPKSEDRACSDQVFVPKNFSSALLHIEPGSLDLGDDLLIIWAFNPANSYKSKR